MKKAIIFIIIIAAAAAGYWYVYLRPSEGPADDVVAEEVSQEALIDAAEKLRATSQGQAPSEEVKTEQEVAAEALADTTTSDTMSSKEQKALIDAAEALKAQ